MCALDLAELEVKRNEEKLEDLNEEF